MKTIKLAPGTEYVRFDELPHLIAHALHPLYDDSSELAQFTYGGARINLEAELKQAVRDGTLPVKDPLTLGPHPLPIGAALAASLVRVADLRAFIADRDIEVVHLEPTNPQTPSERRAQRLSMFEEKGGQKKRGALAELARELNMDRSKLGKELKKAMEEKAEKNRAGVFSGITGQMVKDGKRQR